MWNLRNRGAKKETPPPPKTYKYTEQTGGCRVGGQESVKQIKGIKSTEKRTELLSHYTVHPKPV